MTMLFALALAVGVIAFGRDPYYNDLGPEERIEAMREEYDQLTLQIERAVENLAARRLAPGYGPSKGLNAIRRQEDKIRDLDARHTWLHGQLHPILIVGEESGTPGYVNCRSCGAQTGKEARFERSSLCTRCWEAWTPSTPTAADHEGTAP